MCSHQKKPEKAINFSAKSKKFKPSSAGQMLVRGLHRAAKHEEKSVTLNTIASHAGEMLARGLRRSAKYEQPQK